MKELIFPVLSADSIRVRANRVSEMRNGDVYAELLLHKDARIDMAMLDKYVGPMNWKREQRDINMRLMCRVSIWDEEKKEWIYKEDVGVESNIAKEKGEVSDAFKRACTNWGIGRCERFAACSGLNCSSFWLRSPAAFFKLQPCSAAGRTVAVYRQGILTLLWAFPLFKYVSGFSGAGTGIFAFP